MKALKISLAVVAALILVLVVIAVALVVMFDGERLRQQLNQTVEQRTGRTLALSEDISLGFWPQVAVRIGPSSLSEPRSDQPFARWEGVSATVEVRPLLAGDVVVRELQVRGLEATLVQQRNGQLNIDDLLALAASESTATPKDGPTSLPRIRMDAIGLENARLTFRDAQGASTRADITLKATDVAGEGEALSVGQLALDAQVASADAQMTLRLNTPLDIQIASTRLALPRLQGELDLRHPGLPQQRLTLPLTGQAGLNWGASTAETRLDTRLDGSPVKLALEVTAFQPFTFKLDLDAQRLDVDRYAKPGATPAPSGGTASAPSPIDLSGLNALNGQATVRIGELKASGLTLNELRLGMTARQGRIDVTPINAQLYQGTLTGSASLQTAGNRLSLRQALSNVAIAPLLKDLADNDKLEGRGNVTLDVNTRGATTQDWVRALQGTASIDLKDGAIRGINLAQVVRNAQQLLGSSRAAALNTDPSQKTDFSELSASFQISQGIATNRDLSLKAPLIRLAGEGRVNLPDQTLDYLLKPTLVATSQGQGGREASDLRGLTVPVRLTGPLANPNWRLELGSAVADTLRSTVQEKVEEKLQPPQTDQIRDRLRGLIGR